VKWAEYCGNIPEGAGVEEKVHHGEFPLMLSFIIGLVVFVAASAFLHSYLDNWGLDKGKGRTLLVLTLASMLSYGAVALVDHFTGEPSLLDQLMATPPTLSQPDSSAVPMQ
jgi:hypothetical protein